MNYSVLNVPKSWSSYILCELTLLYHLRCHVCVAVFPVWACRSLLVSWSCGSGGCTSRGWLHFTGGRTGSLLRSMWCNVVSVGQHSPEKIYMGIFDWHTCRCCSGFFSMPPPPHTLALQISDFHKNILSCILTGKSNFMTDSMNRNFPTSSTIFFFLPRGSNLKVRQWSHVLNNAFGTDKADLPVMIFHCPSESIFSWRVKKM